ncbi:NAD(P)-dependent oxidoreductase [Chitinispirillales bacterium ANBcel5]|uniref:NAD-dependent epimerase/dehydratase family protein n=1 Tax=Cellulosispirillum alkaliphilum TaxID=3039283 RepID=UPI002A577530|nr:NAD(P)-dependent oxidoreductase [Chitinispirillales bacterium ANBcel5]
MGTFLITGVNGFLGHSVLEALLRTGNDKIIGVDIQEQAKVRGEPTRLTYKRVDVGDSGCIKELIDLKPDTVIHLAGVLAKSEDVRSQLELFKGNEGSTHNMLQVARANRSHFLFSSTGLVYGNQPGPFFEDTRVSPEDYYSLSKYCAEEMVRFFSMRYSIPSTIFRIAVLYGPDQKASMFIPSLVSAINNNEQFKMTAGEQKRDFIYIDDVVSAFCMAVRNSVTGLYNLGTGNAVKMIDAANMAMSIAQKNDLLKVGALPYREKESWEYNLNSEKFKRRTGWSAETDLKSGLEKLLKLKAY